MDKSTALSLYLIGLAILQANGKTYVSHEIGEAIQVIQKELGVKQK